MKVTLGDICQALSENGVGFGVFADPDRQISGLHILSQPGDGAEADSVNLCLLSTFFQTAERDGLCFICCEDVPFSPGSSSGADVIILKRGVVLTNIANIVMRELADAAYAASVSEQMLATLTSESALDSIVRTAGEALGCQMVLGDTSHNVLVHNVSDILVGETRWDVFVGRGIVPAFNGSSGCHIYEKIDLLPGCVLNLVYNARLGVYNAICDITSGGREAASLSILTDGQPLSRGQYRIIAALCQAIRLELSSRSRPDTARALSYEGFLINLMESRSVNHEHIQILASKISMPVEGFFAVFALDLTENSGSADSLPLRELIDNVEAALGDSRAVNHNGKIIVLVNYGDRRGFSNMDYSALETLIDGHRLRCGMSRPFQQLYDVHKHYLEALDSVEIAKYTAFIENERFSGKLNYYERCEPFVMMHDAAEHGVDLRKFVHPFAITLNDYDMEHDTEYVRTLFEYIRTPKKPQAAEALFVHRNTLDYRLKKIQELVEFSWDDGETMSRLFFSIIILMYLRARDAYNSGALPAG